MKLQKILQMAFQSAGQGTLPTVGADNAVVTSELWDVTNLLASLHLRHTKRANTENGQIWKE